MPVFACQAASSQTGQVLLANINTQNREFELSSDEALALPGTAHQQALTMQNPHTLQWWPLGGRHILHVVQYLSQLAYAVRRRLIVLEAISS